MERREVPDPAKGAEVPFEVGPDVACVPESHVPLRSRRIFRVASLQKTLPKIAENKIVPS